MNRKVNEKGVHSSRITRELCTSTAQLYDKKLYFVDTSWKEDAVVQMLSPIFGKFSKSVE